MKWIEDKCSKAFLIKVTLCHIRIQLLFTLKLLSSFGRANGNNDFRCSLSPLSSRRFVERVEQQPVMEFSEGRIPTIVRSSICCLRRSA